MSPPDVPFRSPEELHAFMARFLVHDPSHERWLALWTGTLRLLAQQEPRAYRRLLAKLEWHGLAGVAPQFGRTSDGRRLAEDRVVLVGGLLSRDLPEGLLPRVQAYATDSRPVPPRRQLRPPPRFLLVAAYYGARWKLQAAPPTRLKRKGESLEDQAVELVAERFGLTLEAARSTIKRARTHLPAPLMAWIRATPGETWWGATLGPNVTLTFPRARAKKGGALKS